MNTGIHVQGPTFTKEYVKVVDVIAKIAERAQKQGDRETTQACVHALQGMGGINSSIANTHISG